MLSLSKFSIGVGDRFARQAKPQLEACIEAVHAGVEVIPVWNKSFREHTIVGSRPESVRAAAEEAVHALNWVRPWHTDADHIHLGNVDPFVECSDFFTIDVAEDIGGAVDDRAVWDFVESHAEWGRAVEIDGIESPLDLSTERAGKIAAKYLPAVKAAGRIYRHILDAKRGQPFITEISMDETDVPQTPPELLVILAAIAGEGIPVQTVAPKFTGRFNKGVDYVGDVSQFEREFRDDLAVVAHAAGMYPLPPNLKLSVHSGSDKFSIYSPIHRALKERDAGLHLKTAGTTWLEELIGLAEAGGDALKLAKQVYAQAFAHREELCAPYASVVDIDASKHPEPDDLAGWSSVEYVNALRHDQSCTAYNAHLRQLLHVGYKVAAKMGKAYLDLLREHERVVARNVKENIWERHIKPVFIGA